MFERFTDRARRVVVLAQEEARLLNHNYIGTEHILLGLIHEGEGVAAHALESLGISLEAVRARVEARRLAGSASVGTQHYLLSLLEEDDSMASRALAALGVTRDAIVAKLADLDPAGTSDETPEEAGARRIRMRVEGHVLTLEIDDAQLAASLQQAIVGRKARIISGADPDAEAAGLENVWSAVSRTVESLTRRLAAPVATAPPFPVPMAYWRPPALRERASTASYWIVNEPGGAKGYLEVGPGTDREEVRGWLLD